MKTRQGFVSNSSSSSFIVSLGDFASTFDVAREMIEIVVEEREKNHNEWAVKSIEYYKKMVNMIHEIALSGIDMQSPVHFNTTNYDTYIGRYADGYHVSTCNNEPFYKIGASLYDNYFERDEDNPKKIASFIDLDEEMAKRDDKKVYHCQKCGLMLTPWGNGKDNYICDRCIKTFTINEDENQ